MTSSQFQNLSSKSRLVDRIVTELQQKIIEGPYKPGMMLPSERELTEQLGVSRTALREAIRMLVSKGLIETQPGVGSVVKSISGDQITEPLSLILEQTGEINLEHLNQVRRMLEIEIAGIASQMANERDLIEIETILKRMVEEKENPDDFNRLDAEFHNSLAKASHNPLMAILLDSIRELTSKMRAMIKYYPLLAETVIPDHATILECVRAHDSNGAKAAMENHLENSFQIQELFLGDLSNE